VGARAEYLTPIDEAAGSDQQLSLKVAVLVAAMLQARQAVER
jgi:hypothetical protein